MTDITLTEQEKRELIGSVQRTLLNGETGLSDADCNRAGWHIGDSLVETVKQIIANRVQVAEVMTLDKVIREWQFKAWLEVMSGAPKGVPAVDYGQRVTDWLREQVKKLKAES